ncbi:hypothetical protein DSO57_1000015 [Entomophthora muscae]|uniref:Uncharacterized protein n=1 Tax=Entomophthora muscae TaxID=34485 RepID=A0ACC2SMS6_9FUNG|nr:hypothetical protein DSO57_1000015 [Entomophthora muscae]
MVPENPPPEVALTSIPAYIGETPPPFDSPLHPVPALGCAPWLLSGMLPMRVNVISFKCPHLVPVDTCSNGHSSDTLVGVLHQYSGGHFLPSLHYVQLQIMIGCLPMVSSLKNILIVS